MASKLKILIAIIFSTFFLILSISLAGLAVYQFISSFTGGFKEEELVSGIITPLNTAIIALATFELGIGVGKEYTTPDEGNENVYSVIRRTITRFVGVVCIALVLESLIMIIKYSQLELIGNLFYPVAVLIGTSALLIALGGFIRLTAMDVRQK